MDVHDLYYPLVTLGSGSFGEISLVRCRKTGKEYAAKVEPKDNKTRLVHEYQIYKKLKGVTGVPQIIDFLCTPSRYIMVMELLGVSLDKIFEKKKKFTLGMTARIGVDMVSLLEEIHKHGIIHRDIKPNNFMFNKNFTKLYIMDFGLSKKYIDKNNEHIKLRIGRSLVGTARYTSLNIHYGFEPSRRDDLESVGYMLVYFLKGKLPWQGIKRNNKNCAECHKNVCEAHNRIKLIGETKMSTSTASLCSGIPDAFREFIDYCKELKFVQEPDYNYLRSLIIGYADSDYNSFKECYENDE